MLSWLRRVVDTENARRRRAATRTADDLRMAADTIDPILETLEIEVREHERRIGLLEREAAVRQARLRGGRSA